MNNRRRVLGLTLIELMVTLVILSILTAIVYPLYQNQVRKARRVEAKSTLMGIALAEERLLTTSGVYGSAATLGTEYTELLDRMTDVDKTPGPDFYDIKVTNSSTSFEVEAKARGTQLKDTHCRVFTVDQLGQRLAKDSAGAATNDACW